MGYENVTKKGYVPKFKMKQLIQQSDKNSPQEYDKIYKERDKSEPHWQDLRRWKELIKYFKGGYIVDIGCLDSKIWDMVHDKFSEKLNYRYLGTDMAKDCIKEMARKHPYGNSFGEPLCTFIVDDLYNSKIKDEIADYIVLGEVLEHLEDPRKAIKEIWKLLKVGGILAVSVPLEEEKEPGACDAERHLWSYNEDDIINLIPGKAEIKSKVLRSKWFPKYKYCWPQLVVWIKKL